MNPTGTRRITRILFASLLLAGLGASCAAPTVQVVRPTVAFSRAQLSTILYRREQGDSLAHVARAIGSTRAEVRLAERYENACLRGKVRR